MKQLEQLKGNPKTLKNSIQSKQKKKIFYPEAKLLQAKAQTQAMASLIENYDDGLLKLINEDLKDIGFTETNKTEQDNIDLEIVSHNSNVFANEESKHNIKNESNEDYEIEDDIPEEEKSYWIHGNEEESSSIKLKKNSISKKFIPNPRQLPKLSAIKRNIQENLINDSNELGIIIL